MFKVNSDRLLYKDEDPVKNSLKLKWCLVNNGGGCSEYFYTFHCPDSLDNKECGVLDSDLRKHWNDNRSYQPFAVFGKLIHQSYGHYVIKPGNYYLADLEEIQSYKSLKVVNPYDTLLNQRRREMKPMATDSILSMIFVYPGLFLVTSITSIPGTTNISGEAAILLLAMMVAGGAMAAFGSGINAIFTGDFLYVGNFKGGNGWDKNLNQPNLIYFSAAPNQKTYLGDLDIHLRARGGFWSSRRDGMIDVSVRNNPQELYKELRESFSINLFRTGPNIGKYGVGKF